MVASTAAEIWLRDGGKRSPDAHERIEREIDLAVARPPRSAVILHNDDVNGFDHVVRVLMRVFGYGAVRSLWLAIKAHRRGSSAVWQGPDGLARQKRERMVAQGPDPLMRHRGAQPLRASVEPLEP